LPRPRVSRSSCTCAACGSTRAGTGGLPKGVRLTHGNLTAAAAQLATSLELGSRSAALAGTAFFHAIGLGLGLCAPLSLGAPIVTVPVPAAERVLELVAEHRVTHATVTPAVFEEIAAHPWVERYDTSSLDLLGTGGADLSPGAERRTSERLGYLARGGYGMTEAFNLLERYPEICFQIVTESPRHQDSPIVGYTTTP
jgi:acyl-CoA synthetase (AMP-forming)/AMP-acid ligase II